MKIYSKLILPVIIAAFLFTACSSDDDNAVDTQKPTISIIEPHEEEEIAPGEELHFEAVFTDNVGLQSYKIEIHNAFDDHTHGVYRSAEDNPWSFSQVYQIPAGRTSYEAVQHIDIPTMFNGAPISEGHYHFGVYVTDTSGNEEQAFFEIHIESNDHGHDHDDHGHDH